MGNNVIETRVNKGNTIYEIIWSDRVCFMLSQLSIFDLDIVFEIWLCLKCIFRTNKPWIIRCFEPDMFKNVCSWKLQIGVGTKILCYEFVLNT